MKQSISVYQFRDAFQECRPDNFSYEGLTVLFNWFEEYEESCDTEVEMDVIAICCEYSEDDWRGIADNYDIDLSDCEDDDEGEQTVVDYLEDSTMICGKTASTIVYADF